MEAHTTSIKIGNFLYHRLFPVYKHLYPVFKRRQDAVEIAWMRRLVRTGNQVLDIGANIGFYTLLLADLVGPHGRVHAFEPDATNFKHLAAAARHRNNITLVPKAVSDRSHQLLIYTSPLLNVDHRTYKVANYNEAIPIDGVSIDEYVDDRFPVDFIKMDIQGYELYALKGMERTVRANPQLVIFSEFWPHALKECGTSAMAVYDYIRSLGLRIWLPEQNHLRPVDLTTVEHLREHETVYYNVILSRRQIGLG